MNSWPKGKAPACPDCATRDPKVSPNHITTKGAARCHACYTWLRALAKHNQPLPKTESVIQAEALPDRVMGHLKRSGPTPLAELASRVACTPGQALDALLTLQQRGVNVGQFGDRWSLERSTPAGSASNLAPVSSDTSGKYRFGWLGDTHCGSKYARLDALKDAYRRFADLGITRVYHTGNWIDGEFSENRHDLLVHGMDGQINYLIQEYPRVPGLTTYAVAGNDHEGWYGKREGIDIGRHAELLMRQAGREDWVHLGHMEAFVALEHVKAHTRAMLHVMHPGGGSAYATSYTVQKIVEGYEGGEKPAVLLAGHYHKLEFICTRNVWVVQTGCMQDQTPWARQKKLRFELGAGVCELEQDATTGAILGCGVTMWQYFNQGFYTNQRWSHGGGVAQVPRVRKAVEMAKRRASYYRVELGRVWAVLWDGKISEAFIQDDPRLATDGYMDGHSKHITINPVHATCDTVVHELIHRNHPGWSEVAVKRMTTMLLHRMSDEERIALYEEYTRRVHKRKRPRDVREASESRDI